MKYMIKKWIAGFIITICINGCSPKVYDKMNWSSNKVIIDGNSNDWHIPLRFYNSDSKLYYDIANDTANLYISFMADNRITKIKILRKGIYIAMDTANWKKYPIRMTYPLFKRIQPNGLKPEYIQKTDAEKPDSDFFKRYFQRGEPQMLLTGFRHTGINEIMSAKNPLGIEAKMNRLNDSILFCEIKIPFSTFYKERITAADTLKPLSFKIILEPMEQPQMGPNGFRGSPQGGGGFPGGNDGQTGGFPGGGNAGPPAGSRFPPQGEFSPGGMEYSSKQFDKNVIKCRLLPSLK